MEIFVDAINHCGLREVDYVGPRFTWIYQRKDGEQIRERLDRAFATQEWMDLFPTTKLHHLSSLASDHSPLSLHLEYQQKKMKVRRMFKFEYMRLKDRRCEEIVKTEWEEEEIIATDRVLERCLERCRAELSAWNKSEFGHVGRKISELQSRFEGLERQPSSTEQIRELKNTRVELNCWLDKEDVMWRQRSRLNWFQRGDRNTSFFHAKASARQKKNLIVGLMDANDVWQEDDARMEEIVVEYYNNLFSSSNPEDFSELLAAVQLKVSLAMNEELTRVFTGMEVRLALK
ncbi:uncharacterized protein LOC111990942 [Quercus suber]|uniref:uncharacterized protein LOC111990942 n=1 Tax=Quercus suber TaxID=58331 RepID=UPI000CE1699C|nr:uncharacterized protein LOC111990942 [Quercus suber]